MNKVQKEQLRKEIFISYVLERISPYTEELLEKYPFHRFDVHISGSTGIKTIMNEKENFLFDRDLRDVFTSLRQLHLSNDDISLKNLENAAYASCFRVHSSVDYVKMLMNEFNKIFYIGGPLLCWPRTTYTNIPSNFPNILEMYLYGYPGVIHTDISKYIKGRKLFKALSHIARMDVNCILHSTALELCLRADAVRHILEEDRTTPIAFYMHLNKIREIHMEQNGPKFKISENLGKIQ